MSNYNSIIEQNNIELQGILDTVNELPDAGSIELSTITITGTEVVYILYVDVNGVSQFASCSPGTILQSIVGSAIMINWGTCAYKQQVTGIDMQWRIPRTTITLTPVEFEGVFYDMSPQYAYYGFIQNSEVTIYAETD